MYIYVYIYFCIYLNMPTFEQNKTFSSIMRRRIDLFLKLTWLNLKTQVAHVHSHLVNLHDAIFYFQFY